jgi:hypothetical protein
MLTKNPTQEMHCQSHTHPLHPARPIAEFGPSLPRILGLGLLLSPCLVLSPCFLVAALAGRTSFLLPGLFLLAVAGPLFWFLCIRPLRQSVQLYPDYFVFRNGSRAQVVEFDEIVSFYRSVEQPVVYGILLPPKFFFTIVTEDGRRVKLNSFLAGVGRLGEAIQLAIFDRHLAEAERQLEAGGSVDFDFLEVEPAGLVRGGETLPWRRVRDLTFYDGRFYVWETGTRAAWASGSMANVANLDVLLALVRTHGSQARKAAGGH